MNKSIQKKQKSKTIKIKVNRIKVNRIKTKAKTKGTKNIFLVVVLFRFCFFCFYLLCLSVYLCLCPCLCLSVCLSVCLFVPLQKSMFKCDMTQVQHM